MKKILLANEDGETKSYQSVMKALGAEFDCMNRFPDDAENVLPQYDGLLLPGGDDIDPALFGQENMGSRTIDRALDDAQMSLMDYFVKHNKPILGICKGAQIINVYFHGDIIQDLDDERRAHHTYHDGTGEEHVTYISKGNFLYDIYGSEMITNSFHHQAIGRPGDGLVVIQKSDDDVIEGMVHESLPIISLQWHPERMCFERHEEGKSDSKPVFDHFLELMDRGL